MVSGASEHALLTIQRSLTEGQYQSALQLVHEQLENHPEDVQLFYMAAVCHRYLSQYESVQRYLDKLKLAKGDQGRAYQEQGYLHKAQNNLVSALNAFITATQLNPALISSWKAVVDLSQRLGQRARFEFATQQLNYYSAQHKAVLAVVDLLAQGKTLKAESICRKFLQRNPTHVQAMRLLAEIGAKLGEFEDAEFLLESAVALAPNDIALNIEYVAMLRKRHQYLKSLHAAEALFKRAPENPQVKSVYAIEKMHMADYEGALLLFDQVIEQIGQDPVTLTSRGHALKTSGKSDDAVDAYKAALKANPSHGDAWYSLANLKTYRFDSSEMNNMLRQEKDVDLSPTHKVQLNFALGKAYEDAKNFKRAFEHYDAGNKMKRIQSNYNPSKMTAELAAQREFFTSEFLSEHRASGCKAHDPIFIVGLPRAGSTLLEQILSSHSQVDGTLELPNILSIAQTLRRKGYPSQLADLSSDELEDLGQKYIDETRLHRQDAPFFIDKMPNNFRHIGLIKLILPNAKIIDARREPMACCFSGFKQLFAEGQEFSYSLSDIGHYYRDYVQLMDHWQSVFPKEILLMKYEKVVADFENQVRILLDYCNLPFEAACLSFYKTERAVRTASSEQVRRPIYNTGLDAWKNFEPYLHPLKEALNKEALNNGE